MTYGKGGRTVDVPAANAQLVARHFPPRVLASIDQGKTLGIRAGAPSDHRFIGIWAVVVENRVFARSWTRAPGGWYQTLLADPVGTIKVGVRTIPVCARRVRSERLRDAVELAYAEKYPTPGSAKYVRGFRSARRRETTIEFLPRS